MQPFQILESHSRNPTERWANSPSAASETALNCGCCKARADYEEPSNEELGIKPYPLWVRLLTIASPYILIAVAYATYLLVAEWMGWL